MKRIVGICLVVLFVVLALPCNVQAEEVQLFSNDTVYFSDGSYIVTEIQNSQARDASQSKTHTYYNGDDDIVWRIILTGTFRYNGSVATCTGATCDVEINDSRWYVVSKTAYCELATATCEVTMGRKALGVTVETPSFELSITCIRYGVYV